MATWILRIRYAAYKSSVSRATSPRDAYILDLLHSCFECVPFPFLPISFFLIYPPFSVAVYLWLPLLLQRIRDLIARQTLFPPSFKFKKLFVASFASSFYHLSLVKIVQKQFPSLPLLSRTSNWTNEEEKLFQKKTIRISGKIFKEKIEKLDDILFSKNESLILFKLDANVKTSLRIFFELNSEDCFLKFSPDCRTFASFLHSSVRLPDRQNVW